MKIISHRGNIAGNFYPHLENSQDYIDLALEKSYDVEVDVRTYDGKLFLGHDEPQYETSLNWLLERKGKLWVHCKDFLSLSSLIKTDLNVFYHEKEDYTIISNGLIWAHNLKTVNENCIIPLLDSSSATSNREYYNITPVYGICSDHPQTISNMNCAAHYPDAGKLIKTI